VSRDELYLRHILDAITRVEQYVASGRDAFDAETMRQDAVVRQLEIIGEAAKKLSDPTKAARPQIPWRDVASLRDRLIHGYATVDLEIVWLVATKDIEDLRTAAEALLERGRECDEGKRPSLSRP
jgi:uncharacterized protein with HEPN domain